MFQRVTLAVGLALLATAPANALTITSLYSTGVTAAHVATTGKGADLHWTLAGGTAYTGASNGNYPVDPWVAETSTSRWLTPTTDAADNNATTFFTYSTTFSLAGLSTKFANFSGKFAADDSVTAIILNGTTISNGGGNYSYLTAFNSAGGTFLAGTNTLTFVTLNSGSGPTGLNVNIAGTATVPEASVWGMMIAGFGLVGFASRRRISAVAA